jgi:hypothetical protein
MNNLELQVEPVLCARDGPDSRGHLFFAPYYKLQFAVRTKGCHEHIDGEDECDRGQAGGRVRVEGVGAVE